MNTRNIIQVLENLRLFIKDKGKTLNWKDVKDKILVKGISE